MQTRGAKFRGRNPQLPPSVLSLFRLALFFLLSFPIFFPRLSPLFPSPLPSSYFGGRCERRARGDCELWQSRDSWRDVSQICRSLASRTRRLTADGEGRGGGRERIVSCIRVTRDSLRTYGFTQARLLFSRSFSLSLSLSLIYESFRLRESRPFVLTSPVPGGPRDNPDEYKS